MHTVFVTLFQIACEFTKGMYKKKEIYVQNTKNLVNECPCGSMAGNKMFKIEQWQGNVLIL